MTTLPRFLRWLADKLGGETDLQLRGRMLGVVRSCRPANGTRHAVEDAILSATPAAIAVEFDWKRVERDEVLIVRFRR